MNAAQLAAIHVLNTDTDENDLAQYMGRGNACITRDRYSDGIGAIRPLFRLYC